MQSYKDPFESSLEQEIYLLSCPVFFGIGMFFLDFSFWIAIPFWLLAGFVVYIEKKKSHHLGIATYLLEDKDKNFFHTIEKLIESNSNYTPKKVDSKLNDWPCYTCGLGYTEYKLIEGDYKGYDFLLSCLAGTNIGYPFISFKIKWQNSVKGKLLISFNRHLFNRPIRGMSEIKVDKDFYILSNKHFLFTQKMKDLLRELQAIHQKYKDINFTVFLKDDVIVITLLDSKDFSKEDLNIFFDAFDLLERHRNLSTLFSEKNIKAKIRWDLILMSIPILILIAIFSFGIYAAFQEDKNFAFFVSVILPIMLFISLFPEIKKYRKQK